MRPKPTTFWLYLAVAFFLVGLTALAPLLERWSTSAGTSIVEETNAEIDSDTEDLRTPFGSVGLAVAFCLADPFSQPKIAGLLALDLVPARSFLTAANYQRGPPSLS